MRPKNFWAILRSKIFTAAFGILKTGGTMGTLDKELATYSAQLPALLKHQGKFVLIKGDEVVDTFDTYGDALKQGYDKFGLEHFLVKRIMPTEQVSFIYRHVIPCQQYICQ